MVTHRQAGGCPCHLKSDFVSEQISTVEARNLQVDGTVKGEIKTSGLLDIASTGKVCGDIEVGKVIIADGAIFQGQCQMKIAETETPAPAKKE